MLCQTPAHVELGPWLCPKQKCCGETDQQKAKVRRIEKRAILPKKCCCNEKQDFSLLKGAPI